MHWFDGSTLDLVARLHEPEWVCRRHDRPPGIRALDGVDVIDLQAALRGDSGQLVDALCADALIDCVDHAHDVVARSDGIPLYIEELVANIRQGVAGCSPGTR